MKIYIRAIGVIILLMGMVNGHSQSFLTNKLVAYYPFNGNANDASGNGNDGTVVGAVLTTNQVGQLNSAYKFNGTGDFISFNSPPTTQTDDLTIAAWINPASTNQFGMAVCLGHDDGSSGDGFSLGMTGGLGDGEPHGNHVSGLLGGVSTVDGGSLYPRANAWYHVVMLRKGGVLSFYLNGIKSPVTNSLTPVAPTGFTIGSETGIRFFQGIITDVRIYDRALSASGVQQLYQYESVPHLVPVVSLIKAVRPAFASLAVGTNYQLQVSTDLVNWTNKGSPFTATNSSMVYTQYFDVSNWNQLYFRLH